MDVYVLTIDGWGDGYGSYIFLVGVFDSKEKAENAMKELPECLINEERCSITCTNINDVHNLRKGFGADDYMNDFCLGGYAE